MRATASPAGTLSFFFIFDLKGPCGMRSKHWRMILELSAS